MRRTRRREDRNRRETAVLTIIFIAMFIAVVSGGIFSYWVGSIEGPREVTDTATVQIGEAGSVTTTLNVTDLLFEQGKALVPEGKAALSVGGVEKNVESFTQDINVTWMPDTAGAINPGDNVTAELQCNSRIRSYL